MTAWSVNDQPVTHRVADLRELTGDGTGSANAMPSSRSHEDHLSGNPGVDLPPPSQTLPQIRKSETRARLLDAARRVFSAHGYDLASVGRIAKEAGVSKGSVYVHFDSKEALFRELLLDHVRRRSAATAAQLRPDMPLREGVMRIVQCGWMLHGDDDGPCSSLSTEFFAQAVRNDWGRVAMASIFDHCSASLVHFLDHARERGEVRDDLDSPTAARMMLALNDGLALQWQSQPEEADPDAFLTPMVEMIISYVGPMDDAS